MLHIRYKLDTSVHHGIGLFAGEDIPRGKVIYTPSPLLDVNLTQEQFNSLDDKEKEQIRWWGFFDTSTKKWHVDFDVSRFINHSYDATVSQDPTHAEAYLVATRDIEIGEELTQNYLEFESKEDLEKRGVPI